MLSTYTWPKYAAAPAPEVGATAVRRVPLVIVGAGPVGLAAAIDAAQRGLKPILLDDDDTVSVGSRGLCYAKRTLEILDRLGVGDRVVDRGVTWNVGRTFHRDREVFSFDLLPEAGHRRPGMVNLQQYYLEEYLVDRVREFPGVELRWKHKVLAVEARDDGARLQIETPEGLYTLDADWLIVADGARSPIRRAMGLDIEGKVFQDRFLIADVLLDGEPFAVEATERRFWFEPSFFAGQSALMHRQAADVWRFDFQLGWDADPEAEQRARARRAAHPPAARPAGLRVHRLPARVGQRLHLPVPAHDELPSRAAAVRRRRGAPGLAVRRPRRQLGHPGHRQPAVEAGAGDRRASAASRSSTAMAPSARRPPTRTS